MQISSWKCLEHQQTFIETNKKSGAVLENRSQVTMTSHVETKLLVQQRFTYGNRAAALDTAYW